jgi:hypothetical protein
MNWRSSAARLALLELLVRGSLKRRRAQVEAWDTLDELPWTRRTGRRDEVGLVAERRQELVALLDRVWPGWGDALAALTAHGLPMTPDGWIRLEDAQRARELPELPGQLNRRTAAALVASHSKATLTDRRLGALGGAATTHDGSVRLRPPQGLVATTPRGLLDLAAIAAVLGEVSIPERALIEGLAFEGPVRAALLVENLGAFCDLPVLDGWLLIHVPGWDTATVARLLGCLVDVPVIHFGDIDPNGIRILEHLREIRSDLLWFVPAFWAEFVDAKGIPGAWPEEMELGWTPSLVREVASRGLWLEQEQLAVDPRTALALENSL